jgi:hypothetical protein
MEDNYMLDDDEDYNIDILTPELIEVDKKENTDFINNSNYIVKDKKEIIIEIKIDTIEDENNLDFIDDDFEYIDEENIEDDENIEDEETETEKEK